MTITVEIKPDRGDSASPLPHRGDRERTGFFWPRRYRSESVGCRLELAASRIPRERFVKQHFYVGLIPKPFGFRLLLCPCNFVITEANRDLPRSGRQKFLCFAVQRGAAAIEVRGESRFRLN